MRVIFKPKKSTKSGSVLHTYILTTKAKEYALCKNIVAVKGNLSSNVTWFQFYKTLHILTYICKQTLKTYKLHRGETKLNKIVKDSSGNCKTYYLGHKQPQAQQQ